MTVLEIVHAKLNNDELPYQLAVEEVEQAIKNYCNIDKIPEELKFVVANMAVDLVRYEQAAKDGLEEISLTDVSSIKIGDTSINLGKSSTSDSVHNRRIANVNKVVLNYKEQLHRFRRMVW